MGYLRFPVNPMGLPNVSISPSSIAYNVLMVLILLALKGQSWRAFEIEELLRTLR
jgi:high-affinity K+ transport system ATPase subunit B